MWNIIIGHKRRVSYYRHPETRRWRWRPKALYRRHEEQVAEFERRGYRHNSPLDLDTAWWGEDRQTEFVNTVEEQKAILEKKGCECRIKEKV